MCEFPDLWRNTYTHHDLDKETTWKGKVLSLNLHINHSYFNIYLFYYYRSIIFGPFHNMKSLLWTYNLYYYHLSYKYT